MRCSFCRSRVHLAVTSPGATICQPCTANAVQEFAQAYARRTDIVREPRPDMGVGTFHAERPFPLMAA